MTFGRALPAAAGIVMTLVAGGPGSLAAQPALDRAREAGPLTVFPDAELERRFYYLPGPLELARRDGRPAMLFLLTRYSGSRLTGDQGEASIFAHLSFDVKQRPVRKAALDDARRVLASEGISAPDLQLLPIRRTEARVIYAPLAGGRPDTLEAGAFETGRAGSGTLQERRYSLRLDRASAEAMWKMFESERTLVSFSYAYVATGVIGSGNEIETEGSIESAGSFEAPTGAADGESETLRTVRADAFEVLVDPERDADLIRVVDMNADRPLQPNHGVLDVRCYDFRNDLRPDLAMKIVELEGRAANGRTARDMVIFRAARPDEAVHRVRFPFAVRVDAPLRYRVREIAADGEERDLGWEERTWVGVLDVTTPIERLEEMAAEGESNDAPAAGTAPAPDDHGDDQ
ncbi:MAG: hypothetical protein PVF05_13015 [Gemmatimonadales bacterium]